MAKLVLAVFFLVLTTASFAQNFELAPVENTPPIQFDLSNPQDLDRFPTFDPNLTNPELPQISKIQCADFQFDPNCSPVLNGLNELLGKDFNAQKWAQPKKLDFLPKISRFDNSQLLNLQQQLLGLTPEEIAKLPTKTTCPECVTDPEQDVNDFTANNGLVASLSAAEASCQDNDKSCKVRAEDAQNSAYDFATYFNKPELDCNATPVQGGAPIKGKYSRIVGGILHNCDSGNFFQNPLCGLVDRTGFPSVVEVSLSDKFSLGTCSGVIIDKRVVLTAGHCFAEKTSHEITDDLVEQKSAQFGMKLKNASSVRILSSEEGAEVGVLEIVVHPDYYVNVSKEPINDFAFLRLSAPINTVTVSLASGDQWSKDLTFAGFGISTQTDTKSKLRIGHARNVFSNEANVDVSSDFSGSKFCNADSGGPVFAGIHIGCPVGTAWADSNPRLLQGLISSFTRGVGSNLFDKCKNSPKFRIEKVRKEKIATWICPQLPESNFCQ